MRRLASAAILACALAGQKGLLGQPEQQNLQGPNLSFAANETVSSRYVKSTGSPIGIGPVQQSQLDLNLGNYFTATGWQDYDTTRRAMDEVDAYVTAHKELYAIKNPYLAGRISASISAQDWLYPSKLISSHDDQALISTLTYAGPITLKFTEKHMLTNGLTWSRNNYVFDLSKAFEVGSWGSSKLTLAPTFRVAYDDNFFGYNGWNIMTPGGSLKFSTDNISIEVFEKKEFRMNVPPTKRGFSYGGVSVTFNDLPRTIKGLKRH